MAERKPKYNRKHAVALRYAEDDRAPRVVATGAGELAKKILELAEENNIPIREDDELAQVLAKLDLGMEIPPEAYRAVAEVLAFLYRTDLAWRKKKEEENKRFRAIADSKQQEALPGSSGEPGKKAAREP